jgi:arylsulfatase
MCLFVAVAAALGACRQTAPEAADAAPTRPNILFILADDLGYSDLGVNGGEIPTPNLDALARRGTLLTNFYAGMTCSPTRAMFLSGMDSHLAGLGVMGRPKRQDQQDQPGYLGYLNSRVATLAELLADAGYHTYIAGKWHLGAEVETGPRARGFERSFVSLDGAAHLGPWDWRGPQLARYRDGETLVHVDQGFYSTRFYTRRLIDYIEGGRADGRPFFAYLAYTAPHWPLQAPAASIARFAGRYDDGYEAVYARRLMRQKELGLVRADLPPIDDGRFDPRWSALGDEERRIEARHMEIFAAMVSDLDTYVGEVIGYLKAIGEDESTFIVFLSDNGPEAGRMDQSASILEHVGREYDHRLDNLGSATSYVNYGRNWASVSATPFYRHKATAFEGGIHVPAFVHYPRRVAAGARCDATATVMDLFPTFLALAGTRHPGRSYRGREVLPPQGVSLLPLLFGEAEAVHPADHLFGWELYGHRAVRRGRFKLVWDQAETPAERRWRLFDLAEDPFEQHDLSVDDPDRYAEMSRGWELYEHENGVIY